MVVLRIGLLVFLIYQVRSKHHNSLVTVDNVIKTIDKFVHEKQRYEGGRKIRDLKTIGKFKQSTIGNRNTNNNQNKRYWYVQYIIDYSLKMSRDREMLLINSL